MRPKIAFFHTNNRDNWTVLVYDRRLNRRRCPSNGQINLKRGTRPTLWEPLTCDLSRHFEWHDSSERFVRKKPISRCAGIEHLLPRMCTPESSVQFHFVVSPTKSFGKCKNKNHIRWVGYAIGILKSSVLHRRTCSVRVPIKNAVWLE